MKSGCWPNAPAAARKLSQLVPPTSRPGAALAGQGDSSGGAGDEVEGGGHGRGQGAGRRDAVAVRASQIR